VAVGEGVTVVDDDGGARWDDPGDVTAAAAEAVVPPHVEARGGVGASSMLRMYR